jgi:hypothetical protein
MDQDSRVLQVTIPRRALSNGLGNEFGKLPHIRISGKEVQSLLLPIESKSVRLNVQGECDQPQMFNNECTPVEDEFVTPSRVCPKRHIVWVNVDIPSVTLQQSEDDYIMNVHYSSFLEKIKSSISHKSVDGILFYHQTDLQTDCTGSDDLSRTLKRISPQ